VKLWPGSVLSRRALRGGGADGPRLLFPRGGREFTGPFRIAVFASATAVFLALFPFTYTEYNPDLAVLTATLICLIWYSYFTFQAVHRRPPVRLSVGLRVLRNPEGISLSLDLTNHHPEAVLISRRIAVSAGGASLATTAVDDFEDVLRIEPGDQISPSIFLSVETLGALGRLQALPAPLTIECAVTCTDLYGNESGPITKSWRLPIASGLPEVLLGRAKSR